MSRVVGLKDGIVIPRNEIQLACQVKVVDLLKVIAHQVVSDALPGGNQCAQYIDLLLLKRDPLVR